ncbi:hypothetical protein EUX98_g3978 [Antrodiella citrinella]|uniref:DUF6533 domain-containing protein n=1 Tax=Antrodiella citrinella TaxID=2447956 RepID=A0A4V3XIS1_9APHY|nr:hypothetical protein EUX98_g3978 [Antrodiella citrinella]
MVTKSHSFDNILTNNGAAYLRVGSLAVAMYDYVLTLPAEWRFYRIQKSWKLSAGCIMFILLRYISVITLIVSEIGYFHHFTFDQCRQYYLVAPVFKALQTLISQIIMAFRTYNISQRAEWLRYALPIIVVVTSSMEFFTNLFARSMVQGTIGQLAVTNCTGGNVDHKSVWIFYLISMLYDFFTMGVSSYYLMRSTSSMFRMSGLVRVLFYDGIGYFLCLTAVNIVNLILYRASDVETQSSGASLGYTVTWIMSQKILIHLRDAAEDAHTYSAHAVTRELTSARDITRAMRSLGHFEKPKPRPRDRLDDEYDLGSPSNSPADGFSEQTENELDVKVQVEHSVKVDYDPHAYDRETYLKQKTSQGA